LPIVIDSSVAASWAIPDEDSEAAREALELASAEGAMVPTIFWHELRNVLLVSERRGRMTLEETKNGIALVVGIAPQDGEIGSHETILALARKHRLTAYDAAYLGLAAQTGCPLFTLDRRLAEAARAEGVGFPV
jgi:predicted nucleic acid-binding protein